MRFTPPQPLEKFLRRMLMRRLLVPLVASLVVVVAAAGLLVWRSLVLQQVSLAQSLAQRTEDYLQTAEQILIAAANITNHGLPAQNQPYLQMVQESYQHFDSFYHLDKDGRIIQLAPNDPRYLGLDMSRQVYFKIPHETGKTVLTEPFTSLRTGRPAVYMVTTQDDGSLMVGELNLKALQETIKSSSGRPLDAAFIASTSGVLLAHSQPQLVAQQANVQKLAILQPGQGSRTMIFSDGGSLMVGSASSIQQTGWRVVVETPLLSGLGVYGIGLLLAAILVTFMAARITLNYGNELRRSVAQPLAILNRRVTHLALDDFSHWMSFETVATGFIEISELAGNFQRMQQTIQTRQAALINSESRFRQMAELMPDMIFELDAHRKITYANQAVAQAFGYAPEDFENDILIDQMLVKEDGETLRQTFQRLNEGHPSQLQVFRSLRKNGETFPCELAMVAFHDKYGELAGFRGVARDITERLSFEDTLRRSYQLFTEGPVVVFRLQSTGEYPVEYVSPNISQFGYSPVDFLSGRNFFNHIIHPADISRVNQQAQRQIAAGALYYDQEYRILCANHDVRWVYDFTSVNRDPSGNPTHIDWYIMDITERKRAEDRIHTQVQRLAALQTIDASITANADLKFTLQILLSQLRELLEVDAAVILRFNPHMQMLEYICGEGFRFEQPPALSLSLEEGLAGKVAISRQRLLLNDSPAGLAAHFKYPTMAKENFVSYLGIPLAAKGEIKGVLEVLNRSPLQYDQEWMDFLETLAGQAAIAVHNAELLENLQRTNQELKKAYDATIQGWSRALELRDEETEGHSQRVAELTVQLAHKLGLSDEQIEYARIGSLLHDIGKMGVPDDILLKTTPLTEEEWEIMRRHPENARRMLSAIDYLVPAIDIPQYHHEKWDGSGYPYGMKGKQIPIAARIFAVVDVWDALSFDRPYRSAWTQERVREYLRSEVNHHFDPDLVEPFIEILDEEQELISIDADIIGD